jgi:HAD superfamily hydrolase (TIGR01490 family)
MHLALFDLDNTLLAGDSDYLWGRFLVEAGVVDAAAYESANRRFYEQYKAGELDIHAFQRFSLRPLIERRAAEMRVLRERFVEEHIRPIVAPGAETLLARHRERGDELAIITATNRFITEPIAALLGVGELLATEPERVNGRYTGAITGIPCYREGKVARLREWAAARDRDYRDTWFYSDSHNDLPLLETVEHPVAVDPDETLAAAARERGWPVVSLRDKSAKGVFERVAGEDTVRK